MTSIHDPLEPAFRSHHQAGSTSEHASANRDVYGGGCAWETSGMNPVQGMPARSAALAYPNQPASLLLQSTQVQSSAVGIVTVLGLVYGAGSGVSLYYDVSPAQGVLPYLLPCLLGAVALVILAPLVHVLAGRLNTSARRRLTFAITAGATGLLEYAASHWPTNSPPAAIAAFMWGNLAFLFIAIGAYVLCRWSSYRRQHRRADAWATERPYLPVGSGARKARRDGRPLADLSTAALAEIGCVPYSFLHGTHDRAGRGRSGRQRGAGAGAYSRRTPARRETRA